MNKLSEGQAEVLQAVCDTVVPAVSREGEPDGFFTRVASDIGVPEALAEQIAPMPAEQAAGLRQLLDALDEQGFRRASLRSRGQLLRNVG